jgi:dihydrofolate reductase
MFKIIAAVDEEGGMGKDGDLPWTIRNDLSFFRFMTIGDTVVMGRKTFENTGKLPNRRMAVLTSQEDYDKGDLQAHSTGGVKLYVSPMQTVWIGGGKSVYEQYLGNADEVVLSHVDGTYDCDMFFPMNRLDQNYEKNAEFEAEGFTVSRYKLS